MQRRILLLRRVTLSFRYLIRRPLQQRQLLLLLRKVVDFSKATRSNAYNKFSEFVAKSSTVADLEKNAPKSGYQVQSLNASLSAEHYVGGIPGTRDALKWLFEAKQGGVHLSMSVVIMITSWLSL